MWADVKTTVYKGRKISIRKLTEAYNVNYNAALYRYNQGIRDPWELLFGKGAKPQKITLRKDQIDYLRDTEKYRKGQTRIRGHIGHLDDEWDIACDLIGVPRIFSEEVKEAMECTG